MILQVDLKSRQGQATKENQLAELFAEEVGLVIEVDQSSEAEVLAAYRDAGLEATSIGSVTQDTDIRLSVDSEALHIRYCWLPWKAIITLLSSPIAGHQDYRANGSSATVLKVNENFNTLNNTFCEFMCEFMQATASANGSQDDITVSSIKPDLQMILILT